MNIGPRAILCNTLLLEPVPPGAFPQDALTAQRSIGLRTILRVQLLTSGWFPLGLGPSPVSKSLLPLPELGAVSGRGERQSTPRDCNTCTPKSSSSSASPLILPRAKHKPPLCAPTRPPWSLLQERGWGITPGQIPWNSRAGHSSRARDGPLVCHSPRPLPSGQKP